MVDSQFVGGGVSKGVGSTVGKLEIGPRGAPAPGGPLVFSEQDQTHFDTGGGPPALAINSQGLVISVHSSHNDFYYDRGTLGATGGIAWDKSGGSKYASGYGNATVAINEQAINSDQGVVLSVYQHEQGGLYWSGGLYNSSGSISWFNQDVLVCATSSTPAVALTNDGIVVLAYLQGTTLYSQVGAVIPAQKTISWGAPQEVHPNALSCAIAANNNGDVVLCFATATSSSPFLESRRGTLDAANNSIDWSPSHRLALVSVGGITNLALNDNGDTIVTASPAGQPVYNVGSLATESDGHKTIEWQSMSGWLIPNLTTLDTGISVAANTSNWRWSGRTTASITSVASR